METAAKSVDGFRPTGLELIVYAAVSFAVVLWCRGKWNSRRFERLAAKMKGPPAYPFVGSALHLVGTPEQTLQKIIKLFEYYGPDPFKVWMGPVFAVAISKPEDLQIVLNSSKALEKDRSYKFFKNAVGEGLFSAPVHKWKKHRRIIAPVFNANLLEQFFPVFNDKNAILIKNLQKEVGKTETFDLWDYIAPTALDIICQTAMGYNLGTQSNSESEFNHVLKKITESWFKRYYRPWLYSDFINNIYSKFTGLDKFYKILHELPNQVIKEMKEAYAKKKLLNMEGTTYVTDADEKKHLKVFLDTLLELNEAGANFSDDDLRDEVVTMMIAGSETSAVTVCFCIFMLAIHSDIQDKVYDEIYEIFGDGDEIITIKETSKLVYLDQVIKETLRLYPIGPVMLRQLQDDVKISSSDHVLPKGTTCILAPIGTHYFSYLYPNPRKFNPEHFSVENVAKRHKYSFLAFSGGPRGCIGSKYAMLSMKVLVSTFLRNYSVHTHIKLTDVELTLDLLMRSANGYPVTIRPRDRRPTYKRN